MLLWQSNNKRDLRVRHSVKIVPIMVGSLSKQAEAKFGKLLSPYLDNEENFFVISSDFCHW